MTDCWNAAISFIDSASKESPAARILVNLVGLSRSASVVFSLAAQTAFPDVKRKIAVWAARLCGISVLD